MKTIISIRRNITLAVTPEGIRPQVELIVITNEPVYEARPTEGNKGAIVQVPHLETFRCVADAEWLRDFLEAITVELDAWSEEAAKFAKAEAAAAPTEEKAS